MHLKSKNFRVHKVYLQGQVHKVYLLLISRVVVGMWSVVFDSVPRPSPPGLRQCSRRCLVPSATVAEIFVRCSTRPNCYAGRSRSPSQCQNRG